MVFYHPGTCEAAARGRRDGNNLAPQGYDDPGRTWHLEKNENWGPWSCCGHPARSKGCETREPQRGIGARAQFLTDGNVSRFRVVGEDANSWLLSTGRTVSKATEGTLWMWARGDNDVWGRHHSFYSFGKWGYHGDGRGSQTMPGFSTAPPGAEICGTYKILYVAALRCYANRRRGSIFLRRQPKSGSLIIEESAQPFTIGVGGRLGDTASGTVIDQTIFDGEVFLPNEGYAIDKYFGPGYKFHGFGANSEATLSYPSMAANASLLVTKQNDNKGRIYRVERPKAFKLVHNETGVMVGGGGASIDFQVREANEARRICKRRHHSFLCRELGLPCSASALISAFATEPPFIFAEPGDIWIDICLSTKNRTYALARRKPGMVLSAEKLRLRTSNMRARFLRNLNERELLMSADEVLSTPNAGATIVKLNVLYAAEGIASELSTVMNMIVVLYRNGKVSKSDIECAMSNLIYHIEAYAYDNPLIYDYVGKMSSVFLYIRVLTVNWLCEHTGRRLWDVTLKVEIIESTMKAVKKSFGCEFARSCFGGRIGRIALERLLGSPHSKRLLHGFCK